MPDRRSPAERKDLRDNSYLEHLERYLGGVRRSPAALTSLQRFFLLLVNLTGEEVDAELLRQYGAGMLPIGAGNGAPPRAGSMAVIAQPPGNRHLLDGAPALVVVLPPSPRAEPKWHKMADAAGRLEARYPALAGRVLVAPSPREWPATVERLAAALPAADAPGRPEEAAATTPGDAPTQTRTVIAILALPPGGGKSSLFGALREAGAAVVSSDAERARGGSFDDALAALLRTRPVVCYDKNVPNADGLAKMLRVLAAAKRQHGWPILRVRLVVPTRLDHAAAWARVRGRTADDIALNVHTIQGGESAAYHVFRSVFYDECERFLPSAMQLPGAHGTDAFWRGLDGVPETARRLLAALPEAPTLEELQRHAADGGGGGGGGGGSWVGVELPGTKLHVTLVPPKAGVHEAAARGGEPARAASLGQLRRHVGAAVSVSLLRYRLATWRGGERRVGFWEVGTVRGLPEAAEHAPQRDIYHVTDVASLVQCAPRDAAALLAAVRDGRLDHHWAVETLPLSPHLEQAGSVEVTGVVKLY